MIEDVAADAGLMSLMSRLHPVCKNEQFFVVTTASADTEKEFADKKEQVLHMLQKLTNNCKIAFDVVYEEVKKFTDYDPEEKYRIMLEKNASMRQLRELFSEVEIG